MNNAAASTSAWSITLRGRRYRLYRLRIIKTTHGAGLFNDPQRHGTVMVRAIGIHCCVSDGVKAWKRLARMSRDDLPPVFGQSERDVVQGEGAGIFVFEDYDHAAVPEGRKSCVRYRGLR